MGLAGVSLDAGLSWWELRLAGGTPVRGPSVCFPSLSSYDSLVTPLLLFTRHELFLGYKSDSLAPHFGLSMIFNFPKATGMKLRFPEFSIQSVEVLTWGPVSPAATPPRLPAHALSR